MAGFTSLRAAIETKLNTITELQEVKDAHTDKFSGYPAATFEPSENDNSFLTTVENLRPYSFDVYVHCEMEQGGRSNAIAVICASVDAIITAFDEDISLGGACDWMVPVLSNWGEYVSGNGAVKYAKLIIVCNSATLVV